MWEIQFTDKSRKLFKKLDSTIQRRISYHLETKVAKSPRLHGEMLTGDKAGLWRYRVGDYRIIAMLHEDKLLVLVIRVGHRKDVYDF
jgi:mRNA interferase RelE/StbE